MQLPKNETTIDDTVVADLFPVELNVNIKGPEATSDDRNSILNKGIELIHLLTGTITALM